jgi:hypothetical protein
MVGKALGLRGQAAGGRMIPGATFCRCAPHLAPLHRVLPPGQQESRLKQTSPWGQKGRDAAGKVEQAKVLSVVDHGGQRVPEEHRRQGHGICGGVVAQAVACRFPSMAVVGQRLELDAWWSCLIQQQQLLDSPRQCFSSLIPL